MNKVRRLPKVKILKILRLIMIIFVVFATLFPVIWVLLASFKSPGDLMRVPPVVLFRPTLSNYGVVASEGFLFYSRNSSNFNYVRRTCSIWTVALFYQGQGWSYAFRIISAIYAIYYFWTSPVFHNG